VRAHVARFEVEDGGPELYMESRREDGSLWETKL